MPDTQLPRVPSMKDRVSPEEWRMRVDLAACYRLAARYGWVDLIATHISARVPAPEGQHHFLINPFGLLFSQVTASSLVKIDQDSRKIDDSPYPVNPAGFVIHSALHMHNHDAICVLHTHTVAGMAVSMQKNGLLMASQHAACFYGHVGYHDIKHMEAGVEGREILANDLGPHRALIMRNHGLLTTGRTLAEAFTIMHFLEKACAAQVAAQAGGAEILLMEEKTCAWIGDVNFNGTLKHSEMAWPSLLAELDASDPGYKN